MPRLCIYVVGTPPTKIAAEHGVFDDWFRRLGAAHDVEMICVDGRGPSNTGPDTLDLNSFDGFVISGSSASVSHPEPWMESAVELVRYAYAQARPLLGVCFGHQIIGAAFGGSVVENPLGRQTSTHDLQLMADDPLFDGLPRHVQANFAHSDIVTPCTLSPLNGVRILAGNAHAEAGIIAAGPSIRGVQFHPEFTGAITKSYVHARRDEIAADAEARPRAHAGVVDALARARDCPQGERMFDNFVRHWILREQSS